MILSTASLRLNRNSDLRVSVLSPGKDAGDATGLPFRPYVSGGRSFLRIPPFPGVPQRQFEEAESFPTDLDRLAAELRHFRVGGSYWGAQPTLPQGCVLVRSTAALGAANQIAGGRPVVSWQVAELPGNREAATRVIVGDCDPWHVLSSANAVVLERGDELRVIASLLDVPCYVLDRLTGESCLANDRASDLVGTCFAGVSFRNPFTGKPMPLLEAVELCGFWRAMIDSNRGIGAGLGFAFWKQDHVARMLWSGSGTLPFLRSAAAAPLSGSVALWRSKGPPRAVEELERRNASTIEIEDGFLRSHGLGADCVPPLSITVDRLGAYFDASRPSELEELLQYGDFDDALIRRARSLRRLIVDTGLGKYEKGAAPIARPAGMRRHILVPGQVADDRSVQLGGCGLTSNLELLKRVREQAPESYIIYKPHPDVVAGHRRGSIPDRICLQFADEISGGASIASLISMVDEVHVNTSQAGFEALLRQKQVVTYGVPFYAGWGLTTDFGQVPSRRTARRSIDELVAATLLLYPRYLDPVTGLPCPAEILVQRLSEKDQRSTGLLVGLRRLQGRCRRGLAAVRDWF